MRVIICGGRKTHLDRADLDLLDELAFTLPITKLVCGMAEGVDMDAYNWARSKGIPVDEHPAAPYRTKYGGHGPKIRNGQMAMVADCCIAFPGGRGTADMVDKAETQGLTVIDYRRPGNGRIHYGWKAA